MAYLFSKRSYLSRSVSWKRKSMSRIRFGEDKKSGNYSRGIWDFKFRRVCRKIVSFTCLIYYWDLLFSFLTPGSLQLAGMHNIANVYTFSTILFMAVGIVQFLARFCSDTRRSKNFKKSHPTVSLSREQPHRRLSTQEHVVLSYLIDQLVCDV